MLVLKPWFYCLSARSMKIQVHSLFFIQTCYHTNLKKIDDFLNVRFCCKHQNKNADSYSEIPESDNFLAAKQITKDIRFDLQVLCSK